MISGSDVAHLLTAPQGLPDAQEIVNTELQSPKGDQLPSWRLDRKGLPWRTVSQSECQFRLFSAYCCAAQDQPL